MDVEEFLIIYGGETADDLIICRQSFSENLASKVVSLTREGEEKAGPTGLQAYGLSRWIAHVDQFQVNWLQSKILAGETSPLSSTRKWLDKAERAPAHSFRVVARVRFYESGICSNSINIYHVSQRLYDSWLILVRPLMPLPSNSMIILKALLLQVYKKNERDTKIVSIIKRNRYIYGF